MLTAVSFNGLHQKHTTDCCFHCTTSHCSPSSFKCYAFTAADVKDATVKDYYSKCEPMSGPTLKDWQDGPSSKQMRRPGWMTANTGATGVAGTANVWSGAGFSPDESRGWFRNTTYAIVLDTPLQVHGGVVVELDHAILAHRIANPLDASWNAWDSVYSAPWESSEAKMPRTRRGGLLPADRPRSAPAGRCAHEWAERPTLLQWNREPPRATTFGFEAATAPPSSGADARTKRTASARYVDLGSASGARLRFH